MSVIFSADEVAEMEAMQESLMDRGSKADSLLGGLEDEQQVDKPATTSTLSANLANSVDEIREISSAKDDESNKVNNSGSVENNNNSDISNPDVSFSSAENVNHPNCQNGEEKKEEDEDDEDEDEHNDDSMMSAFRDQFYSFPSSEDDPPHLPQLMTADELHEGSIRVWGHGNKTKNINASWKRAWAIANKVMQYLSK